MYENILKENLKIVFWGRFQDIIQVKLVPFGIYAITRPRDTTPDCLPFELEDLMYVGMAGKSYHDFSYDRKVKKKDDDDDVYLKAGRVYERLEYHRARLTSDKKKYGGWYDIWHTKYGKNKISELKVCVMVPISHLPNESLVRSWLAVKEASMIYEYGVRYNNVPEMNLAHSVNVGNNLIIDGSAANSKRCDDKKKVTLMDLING